MKSLRRKWNDFIRKLISKDVSCAYFTFNQAVKDMRREERRLKDSGLNREEIDDCIGPFEAEVYFSYSEYKECRSRKWQQEAIKISVPLPPHPYGQDVDDPTGYWEFLGSIGVWVLTDKGIHYIRREIREVQRSEHERRLRWTMPLIAVLALIVSVISVSSTCLS